MKLRYYYNNGKVKEHTTYVGKRTILREKEDSTKVSIYEVYTRFGEEVEKYSTTSALS